MNMTKSEALEPTALRSTEQMREAHAIIESLQYLQEVALRINLVFESHLIGVAGQSIRESITHSVKIVSAQMAARDNDNTHPSFHRRAAGGRPHDA
ncbi:MAG: hypothetical protein WD711_03645 [Dongiaceae bacterium]